MLGFLKDARQSIQEKHKEEGSKFGDTLKSARSGVTSRGELPAFPNRPIQAKNINERQANRLARYAETIRESATRHNVPVELICGVILQESGGNPKSQSHAGAKGLMQLMDATAKRFGVQNSMDPGQNIEGGTKYLRWLLNEFGGNVELALAGYNAGEGAVKKYGGLPPYRETKEYVPNVLGYSLAMVDILSGSKKV